jgi:predicted Zn-dependent protease
LLKYSRNQESEADRLGLIFMAMAGYNPDSAVAFWQRMASAKEGGGAPPEFLSSHPSDASRIEAIQNLLPEARQFYKGGRAN